MPYNPYFPVTYNPYSYQQQGYPQNIQPAQQQIPGYQQPQAQQTAPAQGGFIRVQSEDEARRYPVAPGGSVTFIDDNSPHCYVKTVDLSPMSAPTFKRFRLVEEEEPQAQPQTAKNGDISNEPQNSIDLSPYAKNDDIAKIRAVIDAMQADIDKLRFDIDAVTEKSSKKMVQRARKDADEE
jgi:hypothetical protein